MQRIAFLAIALGAAFFSSGCGQSHDDRQASHELRKLSNETVSDVNCAAQDSDHAVHDLANAIDSASANAAYDVHQASLQMRDDMRRQSEVIQTVNPSQLGKEVKRDAVDAAGAAAEEEAARLLKLK
jgi:hypothetical protein